MKKTIYSSIIAVSLLAGHVAESGSIAVEITVGSNTSRGQIMSRSGDLITFRQTGRSGDVSYPIDAIKEVVFPVELDQSLVGNLMQNRMHEELASTLEAALIPFAEYSDLPSNISKYQGVLMELYYKVGEYDKCMAYSSKLLLDGRDKKLQRKAIVFQGLALLGADRIEEAQALFSQQGWSGELAADASAEDIYITAKFLLMKKEYTKALETVAKVIAFHIQDPDWARPAEILCAEAYVEMAKASNNVDFLDSAAEVAREIQLLYKDTDEADQAQNLELRIATLRLEME
jgi:tetratricopeptide (TPR) repeat protein